MNQASATSAPVSSQPPNGPWQFGPGAAAAPNQNVTAAAPSLAVPYTAPASIMTAPSTGAAVNGELPPPPPPPPPRVESTVPEIVVHPPEAEGQKDEESVVNTKVRRPAPCRPANIQFTSKPYPNASQFEVDIRELTVGLIDEKIVQREKYRKKKRKARIFKNFLWITSLLIGLIVIPTTCVVMEITPQKIKHGLERGVVWTAMQIAVSKVISF